MIIEWNENLNTDIPEIDEQHKTLFENINKLSDVYNDEFNKDLVWNIVLSIEEYISIHFYTEEKYMKEYSYPDIFRHSQAHKDFTKEFSDLKDKLEDEGITIFIAKGLSHILSEWIINHYKTEDVFMADFLRAKKLN